MKKLILALAIACAALGAQTFAMQPAPCPHCGGDGGDGGNGGGQPPAPAPSPAHS